MTTTRSAPPVSIDYGQGWGDALAAARRGGVGVDTTGLTDDVAGVIATGQAKRATLAALDQILDASWTVRR